MSLRISIVVLALIGAVLAISVPCCSYDTIVSTASGGTNAITLASGTYTSATGCTNPINYVSGNTGLTISGATSGGRTVIDCKSQGTAMTLTVSGSHIVSDVDFTRAGTGIMNANAGGTVTLVDVGLYNSTYTGGIACLSSTETSVYISNSVFSRCTSSGTLGGSAVYFYSVGATVLSVTGSTFVYNAAGGSPQNIDGIFTVNPGVGYPSHVTLPMMAVIDNCVFSYNNGGRTGGMFIISVLNITNTYSSWNSGEAGSLLSWNLNNLFYDGGCSNCLLYMYNVTSAYQATGSGGGFSELAAYGSSSYASVISNSVFMTHRYGDGVAKLQGSWIMNNLTVKDNNFPGNLFSFYGGGYIINYIRVLNNTCNHLAYYAGMAATWNYALVDGNRGTDPAVGFIQPGSATDVWINCTFSNNQAKVGAVFSLSFSTSLTITGCTFANNFASLNGGAIYSYQGYTFTIDRCTFVNNTALGNGGAMYFIQAQAGNVPIIKNTVFNGNSAATGAVISVADSTISLSNIVGTRNVGNNGLLAASASAVVTLVDSVFTDNSVSGSGGVLVAIFGPVISVTRCEFLRNAADSGGGGYSLGSTLNLVDVTIANSTARYGGALYVGVQSVLNVKSTTLSWNTAGLGGGIYDDSATVAIQKSSFQYNHADIEGGAGFIYSSWTVQNSTFFGNNAPIGGGLSVQLSGALRFYNSTFTAHSASNGAALVGRAAAVATITGSAFTRNTGDLGGAVYWEASGALTVVSSNFSSNSASQKGGAIWVDGPITLNTTRLEANNASSGAAIACEACTLSIYRSSILANVGRVGPALYCDDTTPSATPFFLSADTVVTRNSASDEANYQMHCGACGCCTYTTPMTILGSATIGGDACLPSQGRNCSYSCDVGYAKVSSGVVCNSPLDPTCVPIPCPPLTIPNALVTYSPVGSPVTLSVATIVCDAFMEPKDGVSSALCIGPNWQATLACKPTPCPPLDTPDHGSVTYGDEIRSTATYACDIGYHLTQSAYRACLALTWQGLAATCAPTICPALDNLPSHMVVPINAPGLTGDIMRVTCEDGYALDGSGYLLCTGPNWSQLPSCYALFCPDLAVENGQVDFVSYVNGQATYTCDAGFQSVPFPTPALTCKFVAGRMAWTGDAVPTCNVSMCQRSTSVQKYGDCTDGELVGSRCTIGCDGGYAGAVAEYLCVQSSTNAPGTWTLPSTGSTALPGCIACEPGSYIGPMSGQLECTKCVNAITAQGAAVNISQCECKPGFYEQGSEANCVTCPTGGVCLGGSYQPTADTGYFKSDSGALVACWPSSVCLPDNQCSPAQTGYLCGDCIETPRQYKKDGICNVCPSGGLLALQLFILSVIVLGFSLGVVTRIVRFNERADSERMIPWVTLSALISFLQQGATFMTLDLPFGAWTRAALQWLSLTMLNFDIYAVSLECLVPMTFYSKNNLILAIPLVFGFVCALTALAYKKFPRGKSVRRRLEQILALFLGGITLFYIAVAQSSLKPLHCTWRADGRVSLAVSPTDECYTPEWWTNAYIAMTAIFAYVLMTPVALVILRYTLSIGERARDRPLASVYIGGFKPQYWYFNVIALLQRFIYVALATFLNTDTVFQSVIISLLLFLWVIVMTVVRPYAWGPHSFAEIISQGSLLLLIFVSLVVQISGQSGIGHDVFNITMLSGVVIVLLTQIVLEIMSRQFVYNLQKKLGITRVASGWACETQGGAVKAVCACDVGEPVVVTLDEFGWVRAWKAGGAASGLPWTTQPMSEATALVSLGGPYFAAGFEDGHVECVELELVAAEADSGAEATGRFKRQTVPTKQLARVTCLAFTDTWVSACGCLIWGDADGDLHAVACRDPQFVSFEEVAHWSAGNAEGKEESDSGSVTRGEVESLVVARHWAYAVSRGDGQLRRHDIRNGFALQKMWPNNGDAVTALTSGAGVLVVGYNSGVIQLMDDAAEEVTMVLDEHRKPIVGLHLDAVHLYSTSRDGLVLLWDGLTHKYEQTLLEGQGGSQLNASCLGTDVIFIGNSLGLVYRQPIEAQWNITAVQRRFWTEKMRVCNNCGASCRRKRGRRHGKVGPGYAVEGGGVVPGDGTIVELDDGALRALRATVRNTAQTLNAQEKRQLLNSWTRLAGQTAAAAHTTAATNQSQSEQPLLAHQNSRGTGADGAGSDTRRSVSSGTEEIAPTPEIKRRFL